ncbi:hypothetical protein N5947_02660 [Xanthomonas citri pv. punicae]|nr:hypothetical protein [Xanthomonas citri]MDS0759374.1 hypothetical protein [Xanthomonas citri pv. punicae]MDS0763148.1 hypothetical protein [Xanthomonas citri pv. punicae]MDS0797920.1 hypothetical protein [Xanthomonas citri pv. punicae]MDS0830555.1 hypothetical protein [Xanthomonas citri pv. punicae]MDS0834363.1 hypothetical protein [Xanthomonas citri pv. punicae]
MIVIDHAPADWFLLRADNRYWLDINCTISATGFSPAGVERNRAGRRAGRRACRLRTAGRTGAMAAARFCRA